MKNKEMRKEIAFQFHRDIIHVKIAATVVSPPLILFLLFLFSCKFPGGRVLDRDVRFVDRRCH